MRWLTPLVLLWAFWARAHDADVIYVSLLPAAAPGELHEVVTLTPATLALLAPLDADGDGTLTQPDLDARSRAVRAGFWDDVPLTAGATPCELLDAGATLREGFVELKARLRCAEGGLRQDFKILRVLPPNFRVVLGSQLDGEASGRGFAQGSLSVIAVPRPPPPGAWDQARFTQAFEAGLRRAFAPEVWFAVAGLLLVAGRRWRRGLGLNALLLLAVAGASVASAPEVATTALLVLVALGAALSPEPPAVLALLLGAAVGAREGGGGWVSSLGLAAGSGLTLALTGPLVVAAGALLERHRPRWMRLVRWLPVALVVGSVALRARLSW